jgi:antitoxin MazE
MATKLRTKQHVSREATEGNRHRSVRSGNIKATVKKWGNSAAIRIPATVMQTTHLNFNDVVNVRNEGGRIIIEKVRQKAYELDDLLKGITPENQHQEVDFGPSVGKEVW